MKKKVNYIYFFIPLLVVLLVFPAITLAQWASEEGAEVLAPNERVEPQDFGQSGWAVTFIPAADFQQRSSGAYSYAGGGYIYANSGDWQWWAPVNIPNGVDIYSVRFYYYDSNTSQDWSWFLTRYYGTASVQDIGKGSSSGSAGYNTGSFDPVHIVDNRNAYTVIAFPYSYGATLRFKGARISWRRTFGPAGGQIFPDVPPSHPFYVYINNLAKSGITTGYADGTYRPNNAVTRGQMAAFLARGLGLWHGYNTPNP